MNENREGWERDVLRELATASIREQRRARRWGIFFKFLTFGYLTLLLVTLVDWRQSAATSGKHTALVEIAGVIAPGSDASAERVNAALQAAFKDSNTQGVILRINSPGGSPVQSQIIYDEIRRLKKAHPGIPVHAVVEDVCASGGYYVAAGADRIYVSASSIIGSIGVRMDSFGVTGLMEKLGVERRLLTSGGSKGMLDPFLPENPGDKAHMLGLLKEVHEQFISAVKDGRGKRLKGEQELFTGLMWTGQSGIQLGLADAIGTVDSVARDVIKEENIVDYTQKESLTEKFARRVGATAARTAAEIFTQSAPSVR
jgi:protease-4